MTSVFVGVGAVGLLIGLWLAWALRRSGVLLSLVMAIGVPALTLIGYLNLGQPSLPDLPLDDRTEPAVLELRDINKFRQVTGVLAARLQGEPDNLEGWTMLTRAYHTLGEWSFAIEAWKRVIAMKGADASEKDWADLALLYVQQAEGQVTPAASEAASRALAIDPQQPDAQHFLAMEKAQNGDLAGAIAGWEALLASAPADAGWRSSIEEYLAQARARIAMPQRGPSSGDMAAAAQMSADERTAMIQGMVDGLAARLADAPDDPAGWLRLARAYGVLGRKDDAADALTKAEQTAQARMTASGGDQAEMQAVMDSAAQMRKQLAL